MSLKFPRRGRLVGVDHGTRRIGLAICDDARAFASPAEVFESTGSSRRDAERVMKWAIEQDAVGIVVGLPLHMDGTDSEQTRAARAFARKLSEVEPVSRASAGAPRVIPVVLQDERLSSFEADQQMAGRSLSGAKKRARRDALAAAAILRAFLDTRGSSDGDTDDAPRD